MHKHMHCVLMTKLEVLNLRSVNKETISNTIEHLPNIYLFASYA